MSQTMLFYKKIGIISRQAHKDYRLQPVADYRFASTNHWLPIAGVEFYKAARHYPIVFVKEDSNYCPVVVTGLKVGHNQFVDKKGAWQKGTYIPAFVRRYPFVLAERGTETSLLSVCIDEAYEGWNKKNGEILFDEDGSNSAYLEGVLSFVNNFHAEMKATTEFTKEIERLNLLVQRSLTTTREGGERFTLNDVYIVDEEQIARLYGQELYKLNRNGNLGWLFAHLMSLENLTGLFQHNNPKLS